MILPEYPLDHPHHHPSTHPARFCGTRLVRKYSPRKLMPPGAIFLFAGTIRFRRGHICSPRRDECKHHRRHRDMGNEPDAVYPVSPGRNSPQYGGDSRACRINALPAKRVYPGPQGRKQTYVHLRRRHPLSSLGSVEHTTDGRWVGTKFFRPL